MVAYLVVVGSEEDGPKIDSENFHHIVKDARPRQSLSTIQHGVDGVDSMFEFV